MNAEYSIMSLFAGAGGLDLGFKMEGNFRTLFANEILESPARTYSRNFGARFSESSGSFFPGEHVIVNSDIEKIDFSIFHPGEFDLVIGGPPCQDFSVLRGKNERKGLEVKRGRLYSQFVRALVHAQPKIFVFENVPGLISANSGAAYETIKNDFAELSVRWEEVKALVSNGSEIRKNVGYELLFSEVVDFTRLGVPQNRRRLIIIGIRSDLVSKIDSLSFEEMKKTLERKLRGEGRHLNDFPLTPLEVFEGKPLDSLQTEYEDTMKAYSGVDGEVDTEKAHEWRDSVWNRLSFNAITDYTTLNDSREPLSKISDKKISKVMQEHSKILKLLGYYEVPLSRSKFSDGSNLVPEEREGVRERMKRIPPGENHEFVRGTRWNVKGLMSNIYRRADPLRPAPTIIAYGGGGTWNYHYRKERGRLTNRERARLQTFPDWFEFYGDEQEVRAQIGEAVPPLASYSIAKSIAGVLRLLEKK